MNVEEAWKLMHDTSQERIWTIPVEQAMHRKEAHNVLSLLKQRLTWNIAFGLVIAGIYVVLLIRIPEPIFRAGLGIVLGFTFWAIRTAWMEYQSIRPVLPAEQSVVETLEYYRDRLRAWMILQERVARWVYPVAAATGFIWGASVGAEKPIAEVMKHGFMQVALLISSILLAFGGHFLGKWLTKKAFGSILKQIESTLLTLKSST